MNRSGFEKTMAHRPITLSLLALVVAACNFYDASMLGDVPSGEGGAAGTSTAGTGGAPSDAGQGGSSGTGGAVSTGGAGGMTVTDNGGGGLLGAGGTASSAGAGGGGMGGTAGSSGADASAGGAGGTDADPGSDAAMADAAPEAEGASVDVREAGQDASMDAGSDAFDAVSDVRDAATDVTDAIPEGPPCSGYALSLGGSDFFTIPRPVQDDFTLEAWVKTSSSNTASYFWEGRGVFYADSVSGSANDFGTSILNGKYAFGVGVPDVTLLSTSNVTTGQWIHVAATRRRSDGTMQIFVNGTLENQGTGNTNSLTSTPAIAIGSNTQGLGNFVGLMDELRIWNVVRTQTQISSNMRQRLNGNETGLVGYWRFDVLDAGAPVDSSPTNASATMVGTPLWVVSDAICSP